jgi:hypothetical protein
MKQIFTSFLLGFSLITFSQNIVDFEELTLAPDTFWDGSDLSAAGFGSNGLFFPTYYNAEFSYFDGGFGYSNVTDSITSGYGNLFASKSGSGANNSEKYAIAYGGSYIKPSEINGWPISSMTFYINNGTYAYNSMRDGDKFAKKFGGETGNDPDFFSVTFKAFYGGNQLNTDSVTHYLADFRFTDNAQDYIQKEWTEVNLNSIAPFDSLTFTFASSDVGEFGINTPVQFCLDNISYSTYINGISKTTSSSTINIFPNPSNGLINLDFPKKEKGIIEVLDATGRVVFSKYTVHEIEQINLEKLSNGVYFVRLTAGMNIYNNKFILSK